MIDEGLMLISVRHLVGPILCHKLLFKISVALTTLKHFLLWCLLFDLQTSVRGQNGVEFYQESTGHVVFFLALLLAEIANERLYFARNPMIMVPDMCHIYFYTCREQGLTNGHGHLFIYCFSAITIGNETLMLT